MCVNFVVTCHNIYILYQYISKSPTRVSGRLYHSSNRILEYSDAFLTVISRIGSSSSVNSRYHNYIVQHAYGFPKVKLLCMFVAITT